MIVAKNLTKRYGKHLAIDSLNLQIPKGSVYGFVGPNGAGKSTTMSIFATLLAPSSGDALISGYSVLTHAHEVRKHIGYMPDFFGVYDQLKVTEYLYFYGASYSIGKHALNRLIPQLLELVNLTSKDNNFVDELSRGMKQRLCLARCLIHDPDVLILDEPASGLDPRARIEMRDILKELRRMGKTILISSHILPELAEMCDHIGIIENGRLIASGNVAEIEERLRVHRTIRVKLLDRVEEARQFFLTHSLVKGATAHAEEEAVLELSFAGDDQSQAELLKMTIGEGFSILAFSEATSNLEDVFLAITKGGTP
jgi:ABC-2 type transport system ATP-binding protein